MIQAYEELHRLGHAHSVETYLKGELVGGLYGISQGQLFFGESMFTRSTDASKVAFVTMTHYLKECGFVLIDCQVPNPHLTSLGAKEIPRTEFLSILSKYKAAPPTTDPWSTLWPDPKTYVSS